MKEEKEKTVESIPLGQRAWFSRTVTEADVALFAGITGAFEPLSINQAFAESTPFRGRQVPRMLLASYTWPVSTQIASPGAVTIAQEGTFLGTAAIGDTITVVGEVTEKILEKKIVIIRTLVYNQKNELVMEGSVTELMRIHEGGKNGGCKSGEGASLLSERGGGGTLCQNGGGLGCDDVRRAVR